MSYQDVRGWYEERDDPDPDPTLASVLPGVQADLEKAGQDLEFFYSRIAGRLDAGERAELADMIEDIQVAAHALEPFVPPPEGPTEEEIARNQAELDTALEAAWAEEERQAAGFCRWCGRELHTGDDDGLCGRCQDDAILAC
jgi:hypothetical protein